MILMGAKIPHQNIASTDVTDYIYLLKLKKMCTCGSSSAPQGDVELSCVSVHNVLDAAVTKQRRYGLAGTLCS